MSSKSPTLRLAFAWSLIQHWGARAISFVVFFILARLLSPVDFGLVALSSIVIGFTEVFIDQGFGDAVVQSSDESESFLSTAFWVNMVTAVALMALVLAGAREIAILFKAPKLELVVRVLSITFLFTALSSVQVALLRRRMDYRSLALRTTLANLISGVVACAMALRGFGVWSLVVQQIVYGAVSTAVVWRVGLFRPSWRADAQSFGKLMHFGLKVCGIRTLDLLHTKLIDSLVGIYLGAVVLGVYSVGARLAIILMQLLGSSVADVSLSHFSHLHRTDGDLGHAYLTILKRLSITAVPIFTMLALESHGMVHLFFGKQWDGAAPVFAAMCVAGTMQVLIYFTNSVINAVGRPGLQLVLSLIKLVLFTGAFFLSVSYGIAAVAWALAGVTLLLTVPSTLVVTAYLLKFRLVDLIARIWLPYVSLLVAAGSTYAVGRHISPSGFLSLSVMSGCFVLIFFPFLLALDRESRTIAWGLLAKMRREQLATEGSAVASE